jgi:hypothetical protein
MESAARLLRLDDPKLNRPRRPERSPFYAVLYQFFDRFTRGYEQGFERTFGPLRGIVPKTVERFFGCGLPEGGLARGRCNVCGNEYLVAFSCKQRGFCPSCCAKRAGLWVEFVREQVITRHPQDPPSHRAAVRPAEIPWTVTPVVGSFLPRPVPGLRTAVEGPKARRFHARRDGVRPGMRAEFGVAADPEGSILAARRRGMRFHGA